MSLSEEEQEVIIGRKMTTSATNQGINRGNTDEDGNIPTERGRFHIVKLCLIQFTAISQ